MGWTIISQDITCMPQYLRRIWALKGEKGQQWAKKGHIGFLAFFVILPKSQLYLGKWICFGTPSIFYKKHSFFPQNGWKVKVKLVFLRFIVSMLYGLRKIQKSVLYNTLFVNFSKNVKPSKNEDYLKASKIKVSWVYH